MQLIQVESFEYHDKFCNGYSKARTGSIRITYADLTITFSFRSVMYDSAYVICILKEYDEVELMRLFFNGCDVMLGILEGDLESNTWRHLYANKKTLETTGTTKELMAQPVERRGILRGTILQFMEHIREAIKTKAPVMFDHYILNGKNQLWGRYSFYYLANAGSYNRPLVGYVVQDITQQIEAEKNFFESSKRKHELERFFQHAPMSMVIVETIEEENDIIAIMCNKRHAEGYGLEPEQMAGKRYGRDLGVSQDLLDMYLIKYKESEADTTEPIQFEFSMYRPVYQAMKSYSVILSCIGRQDSGRMRYAGIMLDITLKKQIEAELQRHKDHLEELVKLRTEELFLSEEKFRTLVTSAPNIILTVDPNGVIQFVNRPITNYAKNPVGMVLWDIFSDVELIHGHVSVCLGSDSTLKFEARLNTEIEKWYSLCVKMINKDLAIVVATDITEVKMLAEKLNKAMQAKSRFLANMSHEVRTPLSGIIGMSQCLSESILTSDQAEMVDTIRQCSEVLLTVINDVLDYSKIEAVGLELCPAEISLIKCMEDSLYMVVAIAQRKGLELVLDMDPDMPDRIIGDVVRIRQIILNILNNAVKFTDAGYILVTVTGIPQPGMNNIWEFKFCVKDTGCGIPPGSEKKLFQMFSQLDGSTTRKYGGTGIGLAYARRLIESMRGRIWVESKGISGEGSTFFFTLMLPASGDTHPLFIPISPLSSTPTPSVPKIAIVDPLDVSREALRKRLTKMGFESIGFSTIEQCESFMDKEQDKLIVVFLDLSLYKDRLDKYNQLDTVAIILMSARSPSPPMWTEEKFYPHYLHKPIKIVPLTKTLARSLRKFEHGDLSSSGEFSSGEERSGHPSPASDEEELSRRRSSGEFDVSDTQLSILVVEDNIMNQKVIGRIFSKLGFTNIGFASNGKEALAYIEKSMPDFIIMDVQMPEMDGVECTKQLRAKYGKTWPHIVTVTADVFPEDELKCREAGTTDFLTKPLQVERLKQCLHKCAMQKQGLFSD
jgi:signal transduction histidine kinase/CheY-like chemotaxis protein/PAS domain-containing protein